MTPASAAETEPKQRALFKEKGKYDDYKKRNAAYNRKFNEKKKNEFKNLLKEEMSKLISDKRLKDYDNRNIGKNYINNALQT